MTAVGHGDLVEVLLLRLAQVAQQALVLLLAHDEADHARGRDVAEVVGFDPHPIAARALVGVPNQRPLGPHVADVAVAAVRGVILEFHPADVDQRTARDVTFQCDARQQSRVRAACHVIVNVLLVRAVAGVAGGAFQRVQVTIGRVGGLQIGRTLEFTLRIVLLPEPVEFPGLAFQVQRNLVVRDRDRDAVGVGHLRVVKAFFVEDPRVSGRRTAFLPNEGQLEAGQRKSQPIAVVFLGDPRQRHLAQLVTRGTATRRAAKHSAG